MSPRSRRRQLLVINRRWSVGLAVSVLAVVVGVVGIAVMPGMWVYAALAVAMLGVLTAMAQTIVRNRAGDDIDEAAL